MAVIVEEEESDNVGCKTKRTNNKNKLGVRDFLWFYKALNGFKEDGEAQCDEEDAIDERTQRFGTLPAVRICLGICFLVCDFDCPKSNEEGDYIVQLEVVLVLVAKSRIVSMGMSYHVE